MMAEIETIQSQRNKNKLIHKGYLYVKQKILKKGGFVYECDRRRSTKDCKAKIKVLEGLILEELHEHTHTLQCIQQIFLNDIV